jgi:uncharacterized membrane protein
MSERLDRIAGLVLVAAQASAAAAILTLAPDGPVAMHFSLDGGVDRWGTRNEAAVLTGSMALLSAATMIVLIQRHRSGRDDPRQATAAVNIVLLVTSLIAALMTALAFQLIQPGQNIPVTLMAGISIVFAVTGSFLGKIGQNRLVGIRTPWTLSSRLAWDKTHRLAGRLFFWGGLSGVTAALFVPQPGGLIAIVSGVLATLAITIFEGWRVWRADPERAAR